MSFEARRRERPFWLEGGFADNLRMSGALPNSEGSGSSFLTPTEAPSVMVTEELPPHPTGTPKALGPKVCSSSSSPPKASSVPPSPPKATSGQATPKASPGQTSQQAIPEPVRQDPSVSDGTKLLVERLVSEILKGLQTDPATGELRVSSDGLTQQITTAFQSLSVDPAASSSMSASPPVAAGNPVTSPPVSNGPAVVAQTVSDPAHALVEVSKNMVEMMKMQQQQFQSFQHTVLQFHQQAASQQAASVPSQPVVAGTFQRVPPPPPSREDENKGAFRTLDSKLIPSMPMPDVGKWSNRPAEILGFCHWIEQLTAWLSTLQPAFSSEIAQVLSMRLPVDESNPTSLSSAERERSTRLFYVLKQALGTSSRCSALIRCFESSVGSGATYGYSLLQRLKEEFSITTRGEGLHFRSQLLAYRVRGNVSLKDFIFSLDSEFYSYEKVLSTCNDLNLVHELRVGAPDKYRWLILNLEKFPNCLNYVSLHCAETYESARQGCLDFYQKTVLNSQDFKTVNPTLSPFGQQQDHGNSSDSKPAEKKDLVCFKCGKRGHFARHCRNASPANSNGSRSSGHQKPGDNPSKGPNKTESKGGAKGKPSKGKGSGKGSSTKKPQGKFQARPKGYRAAELNEEGEEQTEGEQEPDEEAEQQEEWSEAGETESELRLSAFIPVGAEISSGHGVGSSDLPLLSTNVPSLPAVNSSLVYWKSCKPRVFDPTAARSIPVSNSFSVLEEVSETESLTDISEVGLEISDDEEDLDLRFALALSKVEALTALTNNQYTPAASSCHDNPIFYSLPADLQSVDVDCKVSSSYLDDSSHSPNFDKHVDFDLTSPQTSHMPFTLLDHASISHDSAEEMPQLLDSDIAEPNLNSVHGVDPPFACHVPLPAFFRCPRPISCTDDIRSVASSARDVAHNLSHETSLGLAAILEEINLEQSGNQFSSVLVPCKVSFEQFADCSHRFSELCEIFTGVSTNTAVIELNGYSQLEISNVEYKDELRPMLVFDLHQQCHRFEKMRHAVFDVFSMFNWNFTCRDVQNMFAEGCMDGVFQQNRQAKPLKCRPQFPCSHVDMQANPYVLHSNFEELDLAYWWLLDSAASKSVVSKRYLDRYEIVRSRTLETPLVFQTADGNRISINFEVVLKVGLNLLEAETGRPTLRTVQVRALVSNVEHNLLSVYQVCRQGWSFKMSGDQCELQLKHLKCHPIIWSFCPWLKAVDLREESQHAQVSKPKGSRSSSKSSVASSASDMEIGSFSTPPSQPRKQLSFQLNVLSNLCT